MEGFTVDSLDGTAVLSVGGSPDATRSFDGHTVPATATHGTWWAGPVAWLQLPWVFALLCVIAAFPLLITNMPPLTDVGGHLGHFAVQVDGGASPSLQQWYSFHWNLVPNLGVDLLVQLLAPSLGLERAVWLIVTLIPALQVAGFLLVARALHGRIPVTALFTLPLVYSYPFLFGFVNFALSSALATCAFALWIELGNRRLLHLRGVLFAAIACVLWIAHLAGWAMFCVLAGAEELIRQRGRSESWQQAATRSVLPLLVLLSPWLLKSLWPVASGGHGATGYFFAMASKRDYVEMVLRDRWQAWDVGGAAFLLALIVWSWRSRWFDRHAGLMFGTVLLAILYLLIPAQLVGSLLADMRLVPFVIAFALLAVCPKPNSSDRFVIGLAIAATLFVGARFAGTAISMKQYDRQFTEDLAVLDSVPVGAKLVTMVLDSCPGQRPWNLDRRTHLSGYAIARRQAFSNDQWETPGGHLLKVHNPEAGKFEKDPSFRVVPDNCFYYGRYAAGLMLNKRVTEIPKAMQYLWLIGDGKDQQFRGWQVVARSAGSILFERQVKPKRHRSRD